MQTTNPEASKRTRHYRDLIVCQKAMTLAKAAYEETMLQCDEVARLINGLVGTLKIS